jgi:hypothetical protein
MTGKINALSLLLILALITPWSTISIDNHHFYRASNFFYIYTEPRLERPWLTSFNTYISQGSTSKARGSCEADICCKGHVDLLQIFGLANMHMLGAGVPGKDLTNPVDIALTNLALLPASNPHFGKFAFTGNFSLTELNLFYTQNFDQGFFMQAHLPVRKMSITCIKCCDLTPSTPACLSSESHEWQTFLHLFNSTLQKYNLNIDGFKKQGIGDTCILLGWTNSYQDTEVLDFVDTTIRTGILIPTGDTKNENKVFDIPLGYNDHFAISLSFDIALGALEWTTIGFHLGTLLFKDKKKCLRLKTDFNQSGPIILAKGVAEVDKGSLWDASIYCKADHFVKGCSLLFGYTFARQRPDSLKLVCLADCAPDPSLSCNDCILRGWKMHTLHFMLDYDFTKKHSVYGPHIGFFYNIQVGGERVFETNMGGGNIGVDFGWKF